MTAPAAAGTCIVDTGAGNTGSLVNMLKKLGESAWVGTLPEHVAAARRLILPGVGAFGPAADHLRRTGLVDALTQAVIDNGTPILGVCLGMQLLADSSDERGGAKGLGWIQGTVERLAPADASLTVPHIGWNTVVPTRRHPLLDGWDEAARFYFTHSYVLRCASPEDILAVTDYGGPFPSMVQREHIFATQFHPEKSHRHGMLLLSNFVDVTR